MVPPDEEAKVYTWYSTPDYPAVKELGHLLRGQGSADRGQLYKDYALTKAGTYQRHALSMGTLV